MNSSDNHPYTVETHPEALLESRIAALHYGIEDKSLTARFLTELDATVALIRENPEIVRFRDDHYRINLDIFPFYLPYIVRDQTIIILAIAHNSRLPGYWKNRLST